MAAKKEVLLYLICVISLYDLVGDISFLSTFGNLPGCEYRTEKYHPNTISLCDKKSNNSDYQQAYALEVTIAVILLFMVCIKEVVKSVCIIGYFFSIQFQNVKSIRFAANSPILLFILPFSERLRTHCIKAKKTGNRTLGLFIDLCLEDIPQLYLPIWYSVKFRYTVLGIISLSGSIIVIVWNIVVLTKHLSEDYNVANQVNDNNGNDGNSDLISNDALTSKLLEMEQKMNDMSERLSEVETYLSQTTSTQKQMQMNIISE
eukprot:88350_1